MALIKCPECGKEISDKASACVHCGANLTDASECTCPECGAVVLEGNSICTKCGYPLADEVRCDGGEVSETPKAQEPKKRMSFFLKLLIGFAGLTLLSIGVIIAMIWGMGELM